MTRIAIVDHGAGNLVSIDQGLRAAGAHTLVASRPADLDEADAVVLPGVGSTGAAMHTLRESGMAEALQGWERPFLGICVGLQVLFESSEEDGGACLGVLAGRVRRLTAPRLPHMGWNDVRREPDPIFAGIAPDAPFYFVHSFAAVPEEPGIVIGTTDYAGGDFTAAVRAGNIVGVQFHPERSGADGLRVLDNFVRWCAGAVRAA